MDLNGLHTKPKPKNHVIRFVLVLEITNSNVSYMTPTKYKKAKKAKEKSGCMRRRNNVCQRNIMRMCGMCGRVSESEKVRKDPGGGYLQYSYIYAASVKQ